MYFSFQVNRRLWTWKSSFHSASSFLTCFWANFFTCLFTWIRHHQNCIGWVLPKNCNRGWKRLPKFCSWKWIGHEEAFGCLGMYRSLFGERHKVFQTKQQCILLWSGQGCLLRVDMQLILQLKWRPWYDLRRIIPLYLWRYSFFRNHGSGKWL